MNFVEPIRSTKKIAQIKNQLKGAGRYRDLLLFVVGINTALRISDLLALRVGDFFEADATIRERCWIREQKRGKRREIIVNTSIREALELYRDAYEKAIGRPEHVLFFNTRTRDYTRAIDRRHAWQVISRMCQDAGLQGNYGTHSLRKTWGYHARLNGVDLVLIMHQLNHDDLAYTKRYLGITDEEVEAVVRRLNL
jgi:site-specific recombinase XerD